MKTIAESPGIEYAINDPFARISQLEETVKRLAEALKEAEKLIAKKTVLIEYYEGQLALLKRRLFGASSERMTVDHRQLTLFGEIEIAPPPPESEEIIIKTKKRIGKREEDLSKLPVVRVEHVLPEAECSCPNCSGAMRDIGVNIRREIEIIPAQAIVKEHAIHSYACSNDDCAEKEGKVTIIAANSPKPLIPGSLASPSLVAHIAYQKYANGMPLYRLENGFKYDGVHISRQNMSNWVIKCVQMYLMAVYIRMIAFLLNETYLHADETTVQVLKEPNRRAQTKSYEWLYRTSGGAKRKIAVYIYKQTREWKHPQEFLKDFKGFVHTDGYEGYHHLPDGVTVVGFSTFRFAKSRASRVRLSCRYPLGARPARMGEPLEIYPRRQTRRLGSEYRAAIYQRAL